jgi:5'-nucleotidase
MNAMKFRENKGHLAAWLPILLTFLAVVGLLGGCAQYEYPEKVPVQILAINDFHGHISADQKMKGRPVGSAPVLAAYLKKEQREFRGFTFIVHAGDQVGASPLASAFLQDEPAIMFLNLLGNRECSSRDRLNPQANLVATVGNHEFDRGLREMMRLIKGGNHPQGPFLEDPWQGATFPYVAANVVSKDTHQPILPRYVIKEVDGIPIAFIGAVLKETKDMVRPSGVAGLEFLDEAAAINACIPELKARQVKSIIVLLHQGGTQRAYEGRTRKKGTLTGAIMKILPRLDDEVDVVVSGHTHSFTNALVPNRSGKKILVTQAWYYGKAYADIELEISRATRDVVKKSAAIVTAWADAGPGLTPDPAATALMLAAEQKVAFSTRKIAVAAMDMGRTPNRAGESALGNLIADAHRWALASDFAFTNPGGIRADIAAGEVTCGELYAVQPFNDQLVRMELTGQQIYDLLNQQFPPAQSSPRMLQVSGLTYTWDAKLPEGHRVVEVRQNGRPLDKAATYKVAVNSFLAEGGDRFSVFTQGVHQVTGSGDLAALISYIKTLPQPFSRGIEGRIQRLN